MDRQIDRQRLAERNWTAGDPRRAQNAPSHKKYMYDKETKKILCTIIDNVSIVIIPFTRSSRKKKGYDYFPDSKKIARHRGRHVSCQRDLSF